MIIHTTFVVDSLREMVAATDQLAEAFVAADAPKVEKAYKRLALARLRGFLALQMHDAVETAAAEAKVTKPAAALDSAALDQLREFGISPDDSKEE